jgi:tetratricopeptide (TPR) repeat protein
MHQELGDGYGEAKSWESIGYMRACLGDHTQAVDCYHRALALLRSLGDRYEEASSLVSLGLAYRGAGDPDAGRVAGQAALAILVELDHPDADEVRERLHTADAAC